MLQQSTTKRAQQSADFGYILGQVIAALDECQVKTDVNLGFEFCHGTARDVEKADIFRAAIARGSFGDVAGYGDRRAPHLNGKDMALSVWKMLGRAIDFARETNWLLPDDEVLVRSDGHLLGSVGSLQRDPRTMNAATAVRKLFVPREKSRRHVPHPVTSA